MNSSEKRQGHRRAFWSCGVLGTSTLASSMVMALGSAVSADVGRIAINDYVTSVELNDRASACLHAQRAAALYMERRETQVGEGWQHIASTVCPQPPQASVASAAGSNSYLP